jgi:hypothetical protein
MAVPNRPAAGGVVESAWGDIVHDEVVAQEIQTGTFMANIAQNGSVQVPVTFPHPFASAAWVVVFAQISAAAGNRAYVSVQSVTANGFDLGVGGGTAWNYSGWYLAYGPRA